MTIILNGTTGITTPDITSSGALGVDASAPDNSLVVNSSGNVGIGVTPSAWGFGGNLELPATNNIAFKGAYGNILSNAYYSLANSRFQYTTNGYAAEYQIGSGGQHIWLTAPSGTAGDAISFTQAMTLTSGGNLLVGTTSLLLGGERLRVAASGSGKNTASFTFDSTDDRAIVVSLHGGSSGGTSRKHYAFLNGGGFEVGSIACTGSATSYVTSSDYRLKEDWQPMTGASERVMSLKPVNFAWKVDGSRVDGFLAHEAQAVVPEAVHGVKDATEMVDITDEEGNVTGQDERPVYQGIDQSKLVPLLTAALQEALTKIDALTARVEALEGATT